MSEIKRTKPKKRRPGSTFTLRGADCHRFLRAIDPTFPLHPDEKKPEPPPTTPTAETRADGDEGSEGAR